MEGGKRAGSSALCEVLNQDIILYSTMESEIIEPCVLGSPKFPSLEKRGGGGSAKNTAKGGIFSLFER